MTAMALPAGHTHDTKPSLAPSRPFPTVVATWAPTGPYCRGAVPAISSQVWPVRPPPLG
ncbi:hypothetical protein T484DRAFT_1961369 [Baffinella frigidus]|nr:hypothetical protein T484DRAFT_1961369 [Cryptophyta sp. CCMP2293]